MYTEAMYLGITQYINYIQIKEEIHVIDVNRHPGQ